MTNLWKAEPSMILAVVSAGLSMGMGFGLHLTVQQMGLIMAFVAAVLGLINRSQVTSPATLQALTPATLAAAQDAAQPVKDTIKKLPVWVLVAGLVGAGLATTACPKAPPTLTTPVAVAQYNADQVVLKFQEVSNVVKGDTGTQPGNIRPADAFTIIEWISGDANHRDATGALAPTTGVVQAIQTTLGQGWKAAAKQAWTTRIRALFDRYPALAPYTPIIDALVEVV